MASPAASTAPCVSTPTAPRSSLLVVRGLRWACCSALWAFFTLGMLKEFYSLRPTLVHQEDEDQQQRRRRGSARRLPRRPRSLFKLGHHFRGGESSLPLLLGTEALPHGDLTLRNLTTFVLPDGMCAQRAVVLPSFSCSLPACNRTRREGKLRVLTNGGVREWVSYLRFVLVGAAHFGVHDTGRTSTSGLDLNRRAQLVDAELELHGTGTCHRRRAWGNFTHQLHMMQSQQSGRPSSGLLRQQYPQKAVAQWGRMAIGDNYRVPLALSARQLATLQRHRRLNLALSEVETALARRLRPRRRPGNGGPKGLGGADGADGDPGAAERDGFERKALEDTCSYYSGSTRSRAGRWPRLHLTYAWRCCGGSGVTESTDAQQARGGGGSGVGLERHDADGRRLGDRSAEAGDTGDESSDGGSSSNGDGGGSSGNGGDGGDGGDGGGRGSGRGDGRRRRRRIGGGSGNLRKGHNAGEGTVAAAAANLRRRSGSRGGARAAELVARPPWLHQSDWRRLGPSRQMPLPWHGKLVSDAPAWTSDSRTDAAAEACRRPRTATEASGGQLGVPAGEAPAVSIVIAYHNNENMTARCVEELWACASELPSAEYLLVDDGSDEVTGELPRALSALAAAYGIRYELLRYPVSVGFTMAATEAARRANGTHLLLLNNDAFVRRDALRALRDTFRTHADVGVVGAKLVGTDDTVQEAGAIVWADGSGAWFHKYQPLKRGFRANEAANHRISYVRDADYVSAAVAMVPRELFVREGMFDAHFSPGYYEDTDLSFTARRLGLRVLYNPFAHVVHMAHSTYQASMEPLLQRNRQQFTSKWHGVLSAEHAPPCSVASACWTPNKQMFTHLAATRLYSLRVLWMDMVLPEPDRDSGSVRTLTMLKAMLAMRCHVSIVSVQRSGQGRHERYTKMLQYLGVHVIPDLATFSAPAYLREPYDVIFVARRDTYAAARGVLHRHYPTALLVYDTVDLHFLRERARARFIAEHRLAQDTLLADALGGMEALARLTNRTEAARLRSLELEASEASSVTIVVSDSERTALRVELRADGRDVPPVVVVANAHEPAPMTPAPFVERHGLVFVGNFNHLPNRDAVLFFARDVLPRLLRVPMVQADPGFVFHVVGANRIPEAILALNNTADGNGVVRVRVHGFVPSLRPLYGAMRVSVAPLRWGAGVKGKVNTAHQLGVPVVCTSLAADGMHVTDGEHALLGDTPEALAAAALTAYYNASVWARLRARGARLLETHFSASRAASGLLSVLAHLRAANTLMAGKAAALGSPRRRLYADLRGALGFGGYYFNMSALEPRLDFPEPSLPDDNYTCGADGFPSSVRRARDGGIETGGDAAHILQRVAASGFA